MSLAATIGDGPFPRTGGWKDASNDVRAVISVAANYELTTLSWGKIWTPASGDPVEARTFVFHRYQDAGHMGITDEVIKRSREFIEQHSAQR